MGKRIDLTKMSTHVTVDRAARIKNIENSVGWGTIVAQAPDRNSKNVNRALTSTGVLIVQAEDGFIITAWIASISQAVAVWKMAKEGKPLPKWLWNVINYNNNTDYWKKLIAA